MEIHHAALCVHFDNVRGFQMGIENFRPGNQPIERQVPCVGIDKPNLT